MNTPSRILCALGCLALAGSGALCSQTANDVGLSVIDSFGFLVGQECGPANCVVTTGAFAQRNTSILVRHHGGSATSCAIAFAFPGVCQTVFGFDNSLLLDPGTLTIVFSGQTGTPGIIPTPCLAALAQVQIAVPASLPPGLVFWFQSAGDSIQTGNTAFGNAVEVTIV